MEENPIRMSDNINHSEHHNIEVIDIDDTSSKNEELIKSKDAYKNTTTKKMEEMNPQFLHDIKLKKISTRNKHIVGMSVLSQWLIPIITTGILYFADYQNIGIMLQTENAECMYESPFSFHNCFETNKDTKHEISYEYSTISIPVYNDYVGNLSLIQLFDLNVTENEIISKVYDIMNSALNNTNDLENKNIGNYSNLLSIENNININNTINNINITDPETNSKEWVIVDDLISYNWSDIFVKHKNDFQIKDKMFEEQIKKLLMPWNSSSIPFNLFDKNKTNKNISQDNYLSNKKNETNSLVKDRNRAEETSLLTTKEQILFDIISRIKSSTSIANKKKGIKTKRSGLRYYNIETNVSTTEMSTIIKENYENVDKLSEITITCTMDKCIISTKFVKLYFFALMFIIYFLPIILSSVLQVRSQFVCQNVLSKLKEKNIIRHNNSHNYSLNTEYDNNEIRHTCSNIKIYDSILKESLKVDKLLRTIKISLIIGVILWTPIFIQTIFKVFLCINVSTWITDCTFLCAIFNDIVRSIFNLNIVTIEDIPKISNKKENTIHPSE
ncbi:hypothetical protein M0802_004497 [Mischocyttarus mexicanus]|nr:hypothetical protein M0802_004497 [Mischocyttarus mexicanus]